ncbi:hypothetical protein F4776DRAFT_606803 [Hypoxylon sp. NC0597]|nr:hypothetical protein F4776DRAFT_606803 [Hypoxylon sp. NC0597]
MGDRSSRDRQSESSRRRHESRRRQTTEYHPRGQGTVHIYRRARDGREGESGSAGPSNQGPAAPNFIWQGSVDSRHSNRGQQPQPSRAALNFYWHDSSNSGRSDRGQHLQIGAAPQSHDLDDRIEQWMQRLR